MRSLFKKKNVNISIHAKIAVLLMLLTAVLTINQLLIIEACLILPMVRQKNISINKIVLIIAVALLIHGMVNTIIGNDSLSLMMKQLVGIPISYIYFDNAVKNENTYDVFKFYLNAALIMAVLVIMQQIGYIVGIKKIYDLRWVLKRQLFSVTDEGNLRAPGFFTEPAACAIAMSPALYIAMQTVIRRNTEFYSVFKAIVIILGYLLTFSSVGYIAIVVTLILFALEYKINYKTALILGITAACAIVMYNKIPAFKMRIDDTLAIMQRDDISNENLSSVTLAVNKKVSYRTFRETAGTGSGIGSYALDYDKYILQVVDVGDLRMQLNREDANSLYLRIIAELGIFGILGGAFFLIRFRVKEKLTTEKNISNAILLYMILRLFRSGHYFHNNMFFFVVLYVEAYMLSKEKNKEEVLE